MFIQNEELPIEWWIEEVVTLVKHVEGIPKKDSRLRVQENLSEFIWYYEAALTPRQAVDKFWGGKK